MKCFVLFMCYFSLLCTTLQSQNTTPFWSLTGNSNASSSSKIGTIKYIPLRFVTNDLERMRITSSGSIGVGTSTPTSRFTTNIASGSPLRAEIGGVARFIVNGNGGVSIGQPLAAPAQGLYVSGFVGLGTATPTKRLHVVGGGVISNGLVVTKELEDEPVVNTNAITAISNLYQQSGAGAIGTGVFAEGNTSGVFARSMGAGPGVRYGHGVDAVANAIGVAANGHFYGVYGHGNSSDDGEEGNGAGVRGFAEHTTGGYFSSTNGPGLEAYSENSYAGYFNGDVYTTGIYETSDESLKQNVAPMSDAITKINQLKPSFYEFRKDARLKGLSLPQGGHYGLIAQDVEKVFPELVRETTKLLYPPLPLVPDKDGKLAVSSEKFNNEKITIKAVNYTELISILVKGIQQMDSTITELKEEIEALKMAVDIANPGNLPSKAFMKQNVPNPVLNSTSIKYFIPNDARAARILLTNAKGQQLKVFNVSGDGAVNCSVGTLAAGAYTYSLVVDGKTISAKKMIIAK